MTIMDKKGYQLESSTHLEIHAWLLQPPPKEPVRWCCSYASLLTEAAPSSFLLSRCHCFLQVSIQVCATLWWDEHFRFSLKLLICSTSIPFSPTVSESPSSLFSLYHPHHHRHLSHSFQWLLPQCEDPLLPIERLFSTNRHHTKRYQRLFWNQLPTNKNISKTCHTGSLRPSNTVSSRKVQLSNTRTWKIIFVVGSDQVFWLCVKPPHVSWQHTPSLRQKLLLPP